jgi:hypothetical protein
VTEAWWRTLLREQWSSGFPDIAGAEAAITVPISDGLLTAVVATGLPPSVPISSMSVRAEAGDRFAVRFKLKSPAFVPPLTIRFAIVGQPQLPASPVLTCVMLTQGIGPFMGPLVRLFATLPPWIRVEQDRVLVNLRLLAAERGLADLLAFATEIRLTTGPGTFVVSAKAGVPVSRRPT